MFRSVHESKNAAAQQRALQAAAHELGVQGELTHFLSEVQLGQRLPPQLSPAAQLRLSQMHARAGAAPPLNRVSRQEFNDGSEVDRQIQSAAFHDGMHRAVAGVPDVAPGARTPALGLAARAFVSCYLGGSSPGPGHFYTAAELERIAGSRPALAQPIRELLAAQHLFVRPPGGPETQFVLALCSKTIRQLAV